MAATKTDNSLNLETVLAVLREVAENQKEAAERQKELDRIVKENALQMKETDRRLGKLGNRFGEIVEYMVAPNLCEKFRELGLIFQKSNSGTSVKDYEHGVFFDIDVMLESGDKAMLVEIKSTLTAEDVKDHIVRIEQMRAYADLNGDKRAFLGAVAGVVMTSKVKVYALEQGLFVIEASSENSNITPPIGKPKEW